MPRALDPRLEAARTGYPGLTARPLPHGRGRVPSRPAVLRSGAVYWTCRSGTRRPRCGTRPHRCRGFWRGPPRISLGTCASTYDPGRRPLCRAWPRRPVGPDRTGPGRMPDGPSAATGRSHRRPCRVRTVRTGRCGTPPCHRRRRRGCVPSRRPGALRRAAAGVQPGWTPRRPGGRSRRDGAVQAGKMRRRLPDPGGRRASIRSPWQAVMSSRSRLAVARYRAAPTAPRSTA